MESLESKLERLTPEQRKAAEDFVDFLLFRSAPAPASPPPAAAIPPVLNASLPPLPLAEPVHPAETRPAGTSPSPGTGAEEPEGSFADRVLFREVGGGENDRISGEYLDYGQFEPQASPATEAVKKVKARLNRPGENDPSRRLLDWID